MTCVCTAQTSSLHFCFFTALFFLIIAVALQGLSAGAETPIRLAPSDKTSLPVPLAVTIPTCGMPETPTQAPSRSVSAVEGFRNCGLRTITVHHRSHRFEDFWYPLQLSEDLPTLQLTIQRKNAQSTVSHQNPLLSKAAL